MGSQTGQHLQGRLLWLLAPSVPPERERAARTGLRAASRQSARERLTSVASQDRSFPSPASKPLLELFSCSLTRLVLKSRQPDSPGRQPRGQRPRQTLSAL